MGNGANTRDRVCVCVCVCRYLQFVRFQLGEVSRAGLLQSMQAHSRPLQVVKSEFEDFRQVISMFKSGSQWKSKFASAPSMSSIGAAPSGSSAASGSGSSKASGSGGTVGGSAVGGGTVSEEGVEVKRLIKDWLPENVVCQLFNVPFPNLEYATRQMEKADEKAKVLEIFNKTSSSSTSTSSGNTHSRGNDNRGNGTGDTRGEKRKEAFMLLPIGSSATAQKTSAKTSGKSYDLILDDSDFKRQKRK
jgi:hypothetical protein